MAAIMLHVNPSFYTKYSKNSLFLSPNKYEKYIESKECCIARQDDKMCFLPNCSYHIILIGNFKDLLQKLDAFCFNYQHVECLYTLFKYGFSGKIVIKNGQLYDFFSEGSSFQPAKQRSGQIAQHRKKETLEEKVPKTFVELRPKDQIDAV